LDSACRGVRFHLQRALLLLRQMQSHSMSLILAVAATPFGSMSMILRF
jgi:hypothetical protein